MSIAQPRPVIRAVLLGITLMGLQACAPANDTRGEGSVAQAFETSDVMHFKPYTRTIFSSTNF